MEKLYCNGTRMNFNNPLLFFFDLIYEEETFMLHSTGVMSLTIYHFLAVSCFFLSSLEILRRTNKNIFYKDQAVCLPLDPNYPLILDIIWQQFTSLYFVVSDQPFGNIHFTNHLKTQQILRCELEAGQTKVNCTVCTRT